MKVPSHVKKLIWWGKADPLKGKKELITQIFNRGDIKDIRWAMKSYPKRVLSDCVRSPLRGIWDEKSLSLFTKIFDVKLNKKTKIAAISSLWRS